MGFKKATRQRARLRLALYGPAGSGKTYTALALAKELGDRIAVIDTEHGSASKYAGRVAEFDVAELTDFKPERYIAELKEARDYPVVVIDSLSHAWMGKGGLLDQADAKGGKFQAWRELTPQHHALIEAMLSFPGHLIVTMRSKTEYEVTKDQGGKVSVERDSQTGRGPRPAVACLAERRRGSDASRRVARAQSTARLFRCEAAGLAHQAVHLDRPGNAGGRAGFIER